MPKAKPATAAAPPVDPRTRPLTALQELICHLAADLVMNGGSESDVAHLLRATISHSMHLQFPEFDHTERIEKYLPKWQRRISRHWPVPGEAGAEHELPKAASDMARANIRRELQSHFEDFLGGARVQDLYLLDNVLMDIDSGGAWKGSDTAESPLAEAFMLALDSDDTFLRVPRDQVENVEAYLKAAATQDSDDANEPTIPEPVGRPKLVVIPSRQRTSEVSHAS
jgi:hypothetical protein